MDQKEGTSVIGIAIVGYGYWGPNLARNFARTPGCRLTVICDQSEARLASAAQVFPSCKMTRSFDDVLNDPDIHAVAIATPAATHFKLANQALQAGKDVLVEKPMTRTVPEAECLIETAHRTGRILAVDHTFLFTDAVRKIKELVAAGDIGELLYIDSVRTNLGIFQPDLNVIYDLAPHELSLIFHLTDKEPLFVQAHGACHAGNGIENLAYLHMEFDDSLIAHFHLNWLAPVKIRQTIVAGTRKMIVYDDMERSEKVKVYDKGIAVRPAEGLDAFVKVHINYRTGDMIAPRLDNLEALAVEAAHFVDCVQHRKRPLADGEAGLKVVRVVEAAQESLKNQGRRVLLHNGASSRSFTQPLRQVA
jgi:predicted dehydrogenase